MVARRREEGESFKQYRKALLVEAKAEKKQLRTGKLLFDARPNGAANVGTVYKPDWTWVGRGSTFRRPRPREAKQLGVG